MTGVRNNKVDKSNIDKLAEKISQNPYFVIFVGLATIVALIIAIILPIIQRRRKELFFTYTTNVLITDKLSEIEDLNMTFKGAPIDHLSVTSVKVFNSGNITIEESDVYKGHELMVVPETPYVTLLFSKVISQSYDTVGCDITIEDNSGHVVFQTFEKGDYAKINIYHTGDENVVFDLKGRIKEGRIKKSKNSRKDLFIESIVLSSFSASIASIIGFIANPGNIQKTSQLYIGIVSALMGIFVFAFIIRRLFKMNSMSD